MNYQKIHDAIVQQARTRTKPEICEKHHVIPKSMGGSNEKANLVNLTPREHFIVHLLLAKIHNTREAWRAVKAMSKLNNGRHHRSSKFHGWMRENYIKSCQGKLHSAETRQKMSNSHKGKIKTSEHRANLSKAFKGKKRPELSEIVKEGIAKRRGPPKPKVEKEHVRTIEQRMNYSKARAGKPVGTSEEVQCPHCGKIGKARGMKVWHFDFCKHNPNS